MYQLHRLYRSTADGAQCVAHTLHITMNVLPCLRKGDVHAAILHCMTYKPIYLRTAS